MTEADIQTAFKNHEAEQLKAAREIVPESLQTEFIMQIAEQMFKRGGKYALSITEARIEELEAERAGLISANADLRGLLGMKARGK